MLIRASRRPAPSPQPVILSRHGVKTSPPPPHLWVSAASSPASCAGDGLTAPLAACPLVPPQRWQDTVMQGHHPAALGLESPGGKDGGGQVSELEPPPVIPQPRESQQCNRSFTVWDWQIRSLHGKGRISQDRFLQGSKRTRTCSTTCSQTSA